MKKRMFKILSVMLTLTLMVSAAPFCDLNLTADAVMIPDGYISVSSYNELLNIRNDLTANYYLTADIDLTGISWKPIGDITTPFKGKFDGGGHIIKGLTGTEKTKTTYFGLFGYISNSEVKNIVFEDVNINGYPEYIVHFGCAAGYAKSSFVSNIKTSGTVRIMHLLFAESITNHWGGVVGNALATEIDLCSNTMSIYGGGTNDEGAYIYIGGIAGYADKDSVITRSYNKGNLEANVGNFEGRVCRSSYAYCAGIAYGSCTIENCYNSGYITGSSKHYKNVAATHTFGIGGETVANCINIGKLAASSDGTTIIAGITKGAPSNCYYLNGTADYASPDFADSEINCTKLENSQMIDEAYFPNLDFDNTWFIDTVSETYYPQLKDNYEETHTHSYLSVRTESTCIEKGVITYTCSCGDTYTEEIPFAEHQLSHVAKNNSCTEDGTEYDICTVCRNIFNEKTVKATEHNYTVVPVSEATCTKNGIVTHICLKCGDYYNETIPMVEHKLTHVTEDATCTKAGSEYDICSECGNRFNEKEIKATGHNYVSAVTKEATCTEKGEMTYTCSCGDSYTEEIPIISHSLTHIKEDSTCIKDGTEYDICSECGNKFNEKEIEATGHSYVSEVTKESTCTETGIMTYVCKNCDDSYSEVIPLAEHELMHFVEKATCDKDGNAYDVCLFCGEIFNDTVIPAAGHSYENGICTVCGKEQNWDYTVNNGTVTITGYAGDDKILEIPSEIGGYPVTAIANEAYAGNMDIEYVSIPNSVFIIGKDAFRGCTNLKEICISDSVSTICEGAFADCTSLAIVFIASANTALQGAFSNNDPRLSFIVQENTITASNAAAEGFPCNTYMYPKEKDGKGAIAVSGTVTLYEDLEYFYWSKLIEKYPYAFYLYFDVLVFDGVEEDEVIILDDSHIDAESRYLTMNEVYISISVDGRCLTFRDLINMLKDGDMEAVITFADSTGVKRTFLQRIGDFFEDVFNLISKAINAIVRVFKKK